MSTLIIELDSLTEDRLMERSRQEGRGKEEVAARLLAAFLETASPEDAEARLLEKMNQSWNEGEWQRYHALVAQRKAENLTEAEYRELCDLTNQREIAYANHLRLVMELAGLRNITFEEAMRQVGIGPNHVE